MIKKLLFITLAAGSMMIASAQTPQVKTAPKASEAVVKEAPVKAEKKAQKETKQKAKTSGKQAEKKMQKDVKGNL